jgi:hypothetical protein
MWTLAGEPRGFVGAQSMSLREQIAEKPAIAVGFGFAGLLIAVVVLFHQTVGRPHLSASVLNSAFYSDDDGATWFIDDVSKLPPFDHNGKPAVRAVIYRYDDNKKFVAYLEKYSDDRLAQIQAAIAAHPEETSHWMKTAMEVKKPGDAKWAPPPSEKPQGAIAYGKVITPAAPDGSKNLWPVSPADEDALNQ